MATVFSTFTTTGVATFVAGTNFPEASKPSYRLRVRTGSAVTIVYPIGFPTIGFRLPANVVADLGVCNLGTINFNFTAGTLSYFADPV